MWQATSSKLFASFLPTKTFQSLSTHPPAAVNSLFREALQTEGKSVVLYYCRWQYIAIHHSAYFLLPLNDPIICYCRAFFEQVLEEW